LIVAGVNVEMEEFGAFSGKWTVKESKHSISRDGGYVTDASIRKGPYKRTMQAPAKNDPQKKKGWAEIIGLS
jgi:phage protein D